MREKYKHSFFEVVLVFSLSPTKKKQDGLINYVQQKQLTQLFSYVNIHVHVCLHIALLILSAPLCIDICTFQIITSNDIN